MSDKCIKLFKSGNFYNVYGDDGIIIQHLLGYKYLEHKKSAGFPLSAYNKVINVLEEEELPFAVYDKMELITTRNGIKKHYDKCLKEALKNYDLECRIARLRSKINKYDIEELEKIVEEIENANLSK